MKKNLTLTGFFVLLALLCFMSPFGAQRVDAATTISTIYIRYGSNQVLSYVNPVFLEKYATTALQHVPAKLRYPSQDANRGYYVDMSGWSGNTTLCYWWESGGRYLSCTGRSQNVNKSDKYAVSLLVAEDYQNGYTFPDDLSKVKIYVYSEAANSFTLRNDAILNKPSGASSHDYVLHIPVPVQTATTITTTGSAELQSYCRNPVPGTFMRLNINAHADEYNFSMEHATIKWYRSKKANMTPSEVVGTGDVYVVKADDIGYYIRGLISPPSPFSPSLYDTSNVVKKSKCYVDVKAPTLKLNGTTVLLTEPKTNQEYFASKTYYSDAQLTESLWSKSFKPSSNSTASIAYGDYGDTWYVYTRVRETATMEAGTDIRRASCYIPLCTIIKDPQDLTVLAGDTASFSIQAKGKIKSYQWRYYNGHSSYNCPGATGSTYSFTAAPGDNGKYYYCVVTDEDGDTYSSDTARLTVNSPVLNDGNTTINCLDSFVYRNRAITPAASVKFKSGSTTRTLQIDKDYTVSVKNNINVGTATITVTGQGIYSGSASRTFQITPVDLSGSEAATSVDAFKAQTWTGMPLIPTSSVKATVDGSVLTLKQGTDYILSYENNVDPGTATVIVIGKGNYTGTVKSAFTIKPASLAGATVTGIKASYAYTGNAMKPKPTVKLGSKTLKAGTDYTVKYTNNVNVGTATVTITGKGNYAGTVKKTFKITAPEKASFQRLYGADRYATSLAIADELKKTLDVTKFDTICVADGVNYPDALAGAYFAYMNKAPIVDVRQNAPTGPQTMNAINYVKANLKTGGRIYILGGPGSVPESIEAAFKKAGFKVERLWGMNRYGSNLEILKGAKIPAGTDFIVTTGTDFADALTASATGKPVLLVVGNKLTPDQKAYLAGAGVKSFTIVGSTNEVSAAIATELKTYAPVSRIGAANVYDRAIAVAKQYFPGTQVNINLADGRNFPDALCGGPLATRKGGPLFLTDGSAAVNAKIRTYAQAAKTMKAVVYGGPASVSDITAKVIVGIN